MEQGIFFRPSLRSTLAGRVHFPRAERHDRFSGGQKAARKVGGPFGAHCYSLACPDPPGDRGAAVGVGRLALPRCSTAGDWVTVSGDCFFGWMGWARRHRVGGESVGPPPDPS